MLSRLAQLKDCILTICFHVFFYQPNRIECISKVAYLDPASWNLAASIVERLKSGTLHGKGYPTTGTFRFLFNCKTPEQKREKLLEYLELNSVGNFSKCKRRTVTVKVTPWFDLDSVTISN